MQRKKKPHLFAKYGFQKNQEKPSKNTFFLQLWPKSEFYKSFFLIFSETISFPGRKSPSTDHDNAAELQRCKVVHFA